jgi:hypothetical protein
VPSATETLFGLSTKHSAPEWKPLAAVVWTNHLLRSRVVPENSSSNVQTHWLPSAFDRAVAPHESPGEVDVGVGVDEVGVGVGVDEVGEGVGVGDVGVGVGVGVDEVGDGVGVGAGLLRLTVRAEPIWWLLRRAAASFMAGAWVTAVADAISATTATGGIATRSARRIRGRGDILTPQARAMPIGRPDQPRGAPA